MAAPEDCRFRGELLTLFRTLCGSLLALQDPEGLWHQGLNDGDFYQETSCSAMFVAAFDRGGNIYGICRGSGHSFTPRYYEYELNWIRNDTHGIGVVLLAGVEIKRMTEQNAPQFE